MVTIALDPTMYCGTMPLPDTLHKAAELGFSAVELPLNAEFPPRPGYPGPGDDFIAALTAAVRRTGVRIAALNAVFHWSSTEELERRASVRSGRRLLELADQLDVREIVTQFSGNPYTPVQCEHQWYRSIEELAGDFEKYAVGLTMKPHPGDFVERHDDACAIVRGTNLPWIGYGYSCPHTFHLDDGVGDAGRMIRSAGPLLREVHVADTFNHRTGDANRYILNPPGTDARVHQHSAIGQGEVPWDEVFAALREIGFDALICVCVVGWPERADEVNRAALARIRAEITAREPRGPASEVRGVGSAASSPAPTARPSGPPGPPARPRVRAPSAGSTAATLVAP